jgi:hypothetical protein
MIKCLYHTLTILNLEMSQSMVKRHYISHNKNKRSENNDSIISHLITMTIYEEVCEQ